ncbi:unnamed protein product [Vitrella brassicaformis CCMP3155]|uniref:Uncharacterized protein n=5 Tax=Vitrella brassicaformis TaxID=1169539 RepID=A0A0G4G6B8_VITBC|nr:unnamed protein product [Vitrella brassicaformis CCMP3155]|eukprot:CEM24108.1 unnamed protein product [Vitrella brassicaformis CCMP3155]
MDAPANAVAGDSADAEGVGSDVSQGAASADDSLVDRAGESANEDQRAGGPHGTLSPENLPPFPLNSAVASSSPSSLLVDRQSPESAAQLGAGEKGRGGKTSLQGRGGSRLRERCSGRHIRHGSRRQKAGKASRRPGGGPGSAMAVPFLATSVSDANRLAGYRESLPLFFSGGASGPPSSAPSPSPSRFPSPASSPAPSASASGSASASAAGGVVGTVGVDDVRGSSHLVGMRSLHHIKTASPSQSASVTHTNNSNTHSCNHSNTNTNSMSTHAATGVATETDTCPHLPDLKASLSVGGGPAGSPKGRTRKSRKSASADGSRDVAEQGRATLVRGRASRGPGGKGGALFHLPFGHGGHYPQVRGRVGGLVGPGGAMSLPSRSLASHSFAASLRSSLYSLSHNPSCPQPSSHPISRDPSSDDRPDRFSTPVLPNSHTSRQHAEVDRLAADRQGGMDIAAAGRVGGTVGDADDATHNDPGLALSDSHSMSHSGLGESAAGGYNRRTVPHPILGKRKVQLEMALHEQSSVSVGYAGGDTMSVSASAILPLVQHSVQGSLSPAPEAAARPASDLEVLLTQHQGRDIVSPAPLKRPDVSTLGCSVRSTESDVAGDSSNLASSSERPGGRPQGETPAADEPPITQLPIANGRSTEGVTDTTTTAADGVRREGRDGDARPSGAATSANMDATSAADYASNPSISASLPPGPGPSKQSPMPQPTSPARQAPSPANGVLADRDRSEDANANHSTDSAGNASGHGETNGLVVEGVVMVGVPLVKDVRQEDASPAEEGANTENDSAEAEEAPDTSAAAEGMANQSGEGGEEAAARPPGSLLGVAKAIGEVVDTAANSGDAPVPSAPSALSPPPSLIPPGAMAVPVPVPLDLDRSPHGMTSSNQASAASPSIQEGVDFLQIDNNDAQRERGESARQDSHVFADVSQPAAASSSSTARPPRPPQHESEAERSLLSGAGQPFASMMAAAASSPSADRSRAPLPPTGRGGVRRILPVLSGGPSSQQPPRHAPSPDDPTPPPTPSPVPTPPTPGFIAEAAAAGGFNSPGSLRGRGRVRSPPGRARRSDGPVLPTQRGEGAAGGQQQLSPSWSEPERQQQRADGGLREPNQRQEGALHHTDIGSSSSTPSRQRPLQPRDVNAGGEGRGGHRETDLHRPSRGLRGGPVLPYTPLSTAGATRGDTSTTTGTARGRGSHRHRGDHVAAASQPASASFANSAQYSMSASGPKNIHAINRRLGKLQEYIEKMTEMVEHTLHSEELHALEMQQLRLRMWAERSASLSPSAADRHSQPTATAAATPTALNDLFPSGPSNYDRSRSSRHAPLPPLPSLGEATSAIQRGNAFLSHADGHAHVEASGGPPRETAEREPSRPSQSPAGASTRPELNGRQTGERGGSPAPAAAAGDRGLRSTRSDGRTERTGAADPLIRLSSRSPSRRGRLPPRSEGGASSPHDGSPDPHERQPTRREWSANLGAGAGQPTSPSSPSIDRFNPQGEPEGAGDGPDHQDDGSAPNLRASARTTGIETPAESAMAPGPSGLTTARQPHEGETGQEAPILSLPAAVAAGADGLVKDEREVADKSPLHDLRRVSPSSIGGGSGSVRSSLSGSRCVRRTRLPHERDRPSEDGGASLTPHRSPTLTAEALERARLAELERRGSVSPDRRGGGTTPVGSQVGSPALRGKPPLPRGSPRSTSSGRPPLPALASQTAPVEGGLGMGRGGGGLADDISRPLTTTPAEQVRISPSIARVTPAASAPVSGSERGSKNSAWGCRSCSEHPCRLQ